MMAPISSVSTMSAAARAASVAPATATPTLAAFSAGASLTPDAKVIRPRTQPKFEMLHR